MSNYFPGICRNAFCVSYELASSVRVHVWLLRVLSAERVAEFEFLSDFETSQIQPSILWYERDLKYLNGFSKFLPIYRENWTSFFLKTHDLYIAKLIFVFCTTFLFVMLKKKTYSTKVSVTLNLGPGYAFSKENIITECSQKVTYPSPQFREWKYLRSSGFIQTQYVQVQNVARKVSYLTLYLWRRRSLANLVGVSPWTCPVVESVYYLLPKKKQPLTKNPVHVYLLLTMPWESH